MLNTIFDETAHQNLSTISSDTDTGIVQKRALPK